MADFDLRSLSAPVEALRDDLVAAYQRLDAKWENIAKCLKALPIPCTVSFSYSFDEYHPADSDDLVWKKWNGKKRICIESCRFNPGGHSDSDYEVTTVPYEEWSGPQRIEMLEHVPKLFEVAEKQTKAFIERTRKWENSDDLS
jgi:hypothetical protein